MAAWVYILLCADGTFYTGATLNLPKRLQVHNSGRGAKYTKGRLPVTLVYQKRCTNLAQAQRLEAQLKKLKRSEKEKLISLTK